MERPVYSILSFPSLHGTPWRTRSLVVARVYRFIREIAAWGNREVMILKTRPDGTRVHIR